MEKAPTIALCMIARNEEALIKNAIESVKSIMNEIIVVDTGSDDATREIAEERRNIRGHASEKYEREIVFTEKLIVAYKTLGEMAQEDETLFGKVVVIDGNKALEEVAQQIRVSFAPLYREWNTKRE